MSQYEIEKTYGTGDELVPIINQPLIVWNLVSKPESPDMSIALIFLNGANRKITNGSDARYFVLSGKGTFFVWHMSEEATVLPVKEGDIIRIPSGVPYRDEGKMVMISINNPAYDPSSIEVLE
jgi:mannose-6-phosphate isomerase-like protein (cupin superfamily)